MINKKGDISNSQTNSNHKKFQKVTPMVIIKKTNSQSTGNFTRKSLIDKSFLILEESIPKYNQKITEIQLEYIQFYENVFKFIGLLQMNAIKKIGIQTIYFEKTGGFNSQIFEFLFKINNIYLESCIASLDSFADIVKDWNGLFLSYSSTYQKIFTYKNN